jgi:hypothetical protein
MVPGARIELATPAFSGRRSTNELPRHAWSQNCKDDISLCQIDVEKVKLAHGNLCAGSGDAGALLSGDSAEAAARDNT